MKLWQDAYNDRQMPDLRYRKRSEYDQQKNDGSSLCGFDDDIYVRMWSVLFFSDNGDNGQCQWMSRDFADVCCRYSRGD